MGGQARQGRRGEVVKEGEERCVREGEVCVRQERRGMGGKGGDERVAVDRCEKERKREGVLLWVPLHMLLALADGSKVERKNRAFFDRESELQSRNGSITQVSYYLSIHRVIISMQIEIT